jgi:uncharacterized membrane-anchored protein
MRTTLGGLAVAMLLAVVTPSAAADAPQDGPSPAQNALAASLHPRQGMVDIPAATAKLNLGAAYDYLGPDEAKKVLVEGWGNPPDAVEGVLGMIFPHGKTFLDGETWGAVITYEKTFYVSDKDVAKSDYDKLLADMQSGEEKENAERQKAGFQTSHLVGWAEAPSYDKAQHNLIWARDIKFGDAANGDTLNYDVRHLGREGVLSLNVVANMAQLPEIREAAHGVAATAEFNPGSRYADYKQGDKVAGFGLVGLVAAGAGLVVAKKAGLVALILLFAKKGLVVILAAGAAIANWARRLFGPKAPAPASDTPAAEPLPAMTPTVENPRED